MIERVWRDGGRFDGWSEHFSYERWDRRRAAELEPLGVSLLVHHPRARPRRGAALGPPRLRARPDWLWADWQDALDGREQDDCRWTPCFDCGVCPAMGTDIQVGPSGTTLLPLTVVSRWDAPRPPGGGGQPRPADRPADPAAVPPSGAGCASCPIATWPAASNGRCGGPGPGGALPGVQPAPAAVVGRGRPDRGGERGGVRRDRPDPPARPRGLAGALDAALPEGLDVLAAAVAEGPPLADRIDASSWRIELPGVDPAALRAAARRADRAGLGGRGAGHPPRDAAQVDVRAALVIAEVSAPDVASAVSPVDSAAADAAVCAILTAVVRQTTPAVRPDDVLGALDVVAGLRPPVPAKATRTAQGLLDDRGGLADPLGPDRVTTRA